MKKIVLFSIILVGLILTVKQMLSVFSDHGRVKSMTQTLNQLEQAKGLKNKTSLKESQIVSKQIIKGDEQKKLKVDHKLSYAQIQQKGDRIKDIYNLDQKELVNYLDEIRSNQKQIQEWKRENGVEITQLELTDPTFALTLSTLLDKSIVDAVSIDRLTLGLDAQDWYYIKTFSESGDVEKLMRQGKLDSLYINMDNLAMAYSNNSEKIIAPQKVIINEQPPINLNELDNID